MNNPHDEELIRIIYNSLEEYTTGSCDMLAHPSNVKIDNRLIGFGMSNVPENNWEAVMVTILHYLSVRMDYNKRFQRATHLVIDETQVVSKKPGSARQLNNAVITFRKFGGIVTMAMQNVTAALSNQVLTELYSNCSYKCFLDQGGVDAQSLGAIQEFSAKEFQALSSGKRGQGVMVWNKKVVLFDSLIGKDNVLYQMYNTDFHEKAKEEREETNPNMDNKKQQNEAKNQREQKNLLSDADKNLILQIAELTDVTAADVMQITGKDKETCEWYLQTMKEEQLLEELDGEEKYRKAV